MFCEVELWPARDVDDARGELVERSERFCLDQAILCGPQIIERFCQLASAGLHFTEQLHISDGDRSLVCEGPGQGDLLLGERTGVLARHSGPPL